MKNQIDEVLTFVDNERLKGISTSEVLRNLTIARSSYYRWKKSRLNMVETQMPASRVPSIRTVTQDELNRIDEMKDLNPEKRHRQIQGLLQISGDYISASTVYNHLKSQGKVEYYARRTAPWKEPRYDVYKANVMWGADWTKLRIGGIRWYLLTLIDFFSRIIVHHEVVPTVNAGHIKRLYESGLENLNLPDGWENKPELRVDQGSPNTSHVTKSFFKDIQADLSYARVRRPTDNAITERFYRTIKQEEIYIVEDYLDETTAKEEIAKYIKWYNEERPHQTLWNFTPHDVHEMNNKTELLKILKELKRKKWSERREYWLEKQKN